MATWCVARDRNGRTCGRPAFHNDPAIGGPVCRHHYDEMRDPVNFRRWPRIVIRGRRERLEQE